MRRGPTGWPSIWWNRLTVEVPHGKLAHVNLYVQAARDVQSVLASYRTHLIAIRGHLDVAVQEAGGYWEKPNLEFILLDPCTRNGHVRAVAGAQAMIDRTSLSIPEDEDYLDLRIVSFSGLHFYNKYGRRIRTRSRPRDARTNRPLRVSKSGYTPPLWDDGTSESYEISILFDVDLQTKTLRDAYLAAIDWGTDDKGREIYYETEIPPPSTGTGGLGLGGPQPQPRPIGPPDDDFNDLLGQDEDVDGPNSA